MSIKDNTEGVLSEADKRIKAKLIQAALLVERTAKQLVRVDTGTLKRSITHKPIGARRIVVGSNLDYAPYQEMGTSKMTGKPYLRPALEANMKRIKKLFGAK